MMKTNLIHAGMLMLALIFAGCATTDREHGPHGTVAYNVEIETSEPAVRIEANGDYIGKSPVTLKIFGDKDGTFHNFGSPEYIIRALPVNTNQHIQTKVFRTGGWWSAEDAIPRRIYFDMSHRGAFTIDLPPRN